MLNVRNAAILLVLLTAVAFAPHMGSAVSRAIGMFETGSEQFELAEQLELANHLDVVGSEVFRRVAIKDALITELISGRTTLTEVTRQFLILDQASPEYIVIIRASYPGNTDEEKTANNVIEHAKAELSYATTVHRIQVLTRLQIEFQLAFPANSGGTHPGPLPCPDESRDPRVPDDVTTERDRVENLLQGIGATVTLRSLSTDRVTEWW